MSAIRSKRWVLIIAAVVLAALIPLAVAQDDWATSESVRGGLHLVANFDSSGDDAWDVAAHPLVYFSSESHETQNPALGEGGFAGFHIIDAYSKEVVAWGHYSLGGEVERGPHGVGISPDGKWAYVGWAESIDGERKGLIGIVNVRTMKLDKVLMQESYYQGTMRSQRVHHIQSFLDSQGRPRVIVQWGFGADGGPHHILDPSDDNRVVRAITYDDVHPMGHPFTTPSPDGRYIYISMATPEIRESPFHAAGIAKLDLDTGDVIVIPHVGNHPIGITHTADGHFTYVIDGHNSHVYKIDNEINEIVGHTSAGVAGPYGIALNWDESRIFTIGKGEGSHNRGGVVGVIDTRIFRPDRSFNQPIVLGGSASSIDHAILHPDPDVNELWISNMRGWETIVLNLDTLVPTDHIPTPNGGDTHSGGFVRYNADWSGELLCDMGGPKSESVRTVIRSFSTLDPGQ
ncbi:MAG: hypothetical protein JSV66_07370 [Trueperaceae bacterium]|nr:MAG: hypothetical protein JSV66_07370 [Trueperaceae bacterium]